MLTAKIGCQMKSQTLQLKFQEAAAGEYPLLRCVADDWMKNLITQSE